MADQIVDIPGVGHVHFPDSMSGDDVNAAAKRLHDEANYQGVPTPGRSAPLETGAPPDPEWMSGLKSMLAPLAHPQTAGDVAGLLLPSGADTPMIRGMLRTGVDAVKEAVPGNPLSFPARLVRSGFAKAAALGEKERTLGNVAIDRYAPSIGAEASATTTPVPKVPYGAADVPAPVSSATTAPAASSGLSATDKAALVKQGYTPDVIQRIEQANAPVTGSLRMDPVASHPLTQPRVDVGAEAVGRANGLSKQAVREATGPVGGEAPGEASDFMPQDAFDRTHDKILGMGKDAIDERKAYANAAKDPKTRGQLMATVRTLSRNGLAAPLVAGGVPASEMLRQELLRRLSSGQTPQGPP